MMKGSSFGGLYISQWIEMLHYEVFGIDVGLVVFLLPKCRETRHTLYRLTGSAQIV